MKDLLLEVQASAMAEYNRAKEKFGAANNSNHESYAVILEEFQEADEMGEAFKLLLHHFWEEVRSNKPKEALERLRTMQEFAEYAAAEWIQVAAMCYKATKKGTGMTNENSSRIPTTDDRNADR